MVKYQNSRVINYFISLCSCQYNSELQLLSKTATSQLKIANWLRGYKPFFMLNSTEHDFFLLINVKMPTIVGILTCMSGKINILCLTEPKNEFLDIFILMSI